MTKIDRNLEPSIGIGSDTPKSDPAFDDFGYAAFAKLIAAAVVKTPESSWLGYGHPRKMGGGEIVSPQLREALPRSGEQGHQARGY